jgi:hypothetical protein
MSTDTLPALPRGDFAVATAPSEQEIAHAAALFLDDLLDADQLHAVTGLDAAALGAWMGIPGRTAEVRRARLTLQNGGKLARLEALRHAREAVSIAAGIMSDSDMAAGMRLNAATYIAKVAGTEKGPTESERAPQQVRVVINLGPTQEPREVVIEGTSQAADHDAAA